VKLIELRRISKRFDGEPPVVPVSDVTLDVSPGDYIALTGTSGSGKSTLLNLIALLDRPTSGSYWFDGIDTATLSEKERAGLRSRRIGVVFQDFHLLPYRDALDNAALGSLYSGTKRRERREQAREALLLVGLGHRLNALPLTLSGGERQRVAIARSLAGSPTLLLCDEPTGNLDSAATFSLLDLLGRLHAEGLTLLVVTHDSQVAARATRRITLSDGRLDGA
jgi:ABC-type lipoprotein export system ATPase subunit